VINDDAMTAPAMTVAGTTVAAPIANPIFFQKKVSLQVLDDSPTLVYLLCLIDLAGFLHSRSRQLDVLVYSLQKGKNNTQHAGARACSCGSLVNSCS
jgi:ABC-type uncharacterized transport system permease subunit